MSSTRDFVGPIGVAIGVDLNTVADTVITVPGGARKYLVRRIVVTNPSATLSGGSLQYGVFSAAAAGGEAILAAGVNSATSLTAASKFVSPTVAQDDTVTSGSLYFRVAVANGSARTADVYLFGDVLA